LILAGVRVALDNADVQDDRFRGQREGRPASRLQAIQLVVVRVRAGTRRLRPERGGPVPKLEVEPAAGKEQPVRPNVHAARVADDLSRSVFCPRRISPNLKAIIYCTAISYGSEEEWDFAWKMYKTTTVASEKDLLLDALGCSRETWILAR